MSLQSGHRIYSVHGTEQKKQVEDFKGNAVGTIRLQPGGWFYTLPFVDIADKLYNFKFKSTDVVVMTYPKCGTTWTQEILWTMLSNPNFDNPMANSQMDVRSPFLEFDFLLKGIADPPIETMHDYVASVYPAYRGSKVEDGIYCQLAEVLPDPRLLKTHLSLSLLNPRLLDICKVVYIARHPRDVAVSYNHHCRLLNIHGFVGTIDSFVDHFINDTLLYSPYWTHMKEAWLMRDHPNMHFCFYEDLKANPKKEILRFQNFVGTKLTDDQIDKVVEYTSFAAMKSRETKTMSSSGNNSGSSYMNREIQENDGGFFRKGQAGDWKNKLNEELVKKIDDWVKKNVEDFGPEFKYYNK